MSRTPVREALQRLEDAGLVESVPGMLTRVSPIRSSDIADAYLVVAALHSLAARLGVPRLTVSDVQEMRAHNQAMADAFQQDAIGEALDADERFHGVLVRASGSPAILQVLSRFAPKIQRAEVYFDPKLGLGSVHKHEEMIVASEAGDAHLVEGLVEENWLSLRDRVLISGLESEFTDEADAPTTEPQSEINERS